MIAPTANYSPPSSPNELVLAWIRRARESQLSHYELANRLAKKNSWIGIPVIIITAVVGTSAFASIITELVPVWAKISIGSASVLAAVFAALQTFFKFSERADRHKVFAAKFGAVRRELEMLHASGPATQESNSVAALCEKLNRLAEEAPSVPASIFSHIQKREVNQ